MPCHQTDKEPLFLLETLLNHRDVVVESHNSDYPLSCQQGNLIYRYDSRPFDFTRVNAGKSFLLMSWLKSCSHLCWWPYSSTLCYSWLHTATSIRPLHRRHSTTWPPSRYLEGNCKKSLILKALEIQLAMNYCFWKQYWSVWPASTDTKSKSTIVAANLIKLIVCRG
jgi:hypothetical protein